VIEAGFGVLVASAVVLGVGLVALPSVDRGHSHAEPIPLVVSTGLAITLGALVLLTLLSALHAALLIGLLAAVIVLLGLRLFRVALRATAEGSTIERGRVAILASITHVWAALIPFALVSGIVVLQFVLTAGSRAPWRGFTPFYYWGTSLHVAAGAGYPSSVREWGTTVPFLGDYLPFNAAAAAFSLIIDAQPLVEMQGFRALVLIVAVSGTFYALRRFFPTTLAVFGVVLLFSSQFLLYKFSGVRPESFGLGLAAWALWALDAGTVERRPALLGIAAVLAALLAASHLPALLVFVALSASMLTCRLMARRQFRAHTLRFSMVAAGALAMAVGVSAVAQVTRGTTTFLGELVGSGSAMIDNVDQTFLLNRLLRSPAQGPVDEIPPSAADLVDARVFEPWGSQLGMIALLLLVVAASSLAFGTLRRAAKRRSILIRADLLLAVPVLVFIGVVLLYVLGALSADTYVPRRTGPDRIAPYFVLAYTLLPLGMAAAAGWIAPRHRVLQLTVLGFAVALVSIASYTEARELPARRPSSSELAEMQRAGAALTSGGGDKPLVLTNSYTEGLLPVLLETDGLLDGRVPYSNAPLRERALEILRATRAFLDSGDCALTDQYSPDFILVTSRPETIGLSRYTIGPRFAKIAREAEPTFRGRFLRAFDYQAFCAAAIATR
jgi:hypothetical protein